MKTISINEKWCIKVDTNGNYIPYQFKKIGGKPHPITKKMVEEREEWVTESKYYANVAQCLRHISEDEALGGSASVDITCYLNTFNATLDKIGKLVDGKG